MMKKRVGVALTGVLMGICLSMSAVAADYTSSDVVTKIQSALNEAGYDCGTPDGNAGTKTKAAISKFREEHGLTAGEAIDDELAAALGLTELVDTPVGENEDEGETENVSSGVTGDLNQTYQNSILEFQKFEVVKDYDGDDALALFFQFTNNASDSANSLGVAFFEFFQNGQSLDYTLPSYNDAELMELFDNSGKDLRDGASLPVVIMHKLKDKESPVTIEITDLTTFEKREATIDLSAGAGQEPASEVTSETQTEEQAAETSATETAAEASAVEEPAAETHAEEAWECPNCGTMNEGKFCTECGTAKPSSEWECPNCGTLNEGKFCSECGTAKDAAGDGSETAASETDAFAEEPYETQETEAGSGKTVKDYIKDYTGMNLGSVGYTSFGGDRRDYYGDSSLQFVIVTPDGVFVDPEDEGVLGSYTVVSQMPASGTEMQIEYNSDEDLINSTYNEIILSVQKTGDASEASEPTEITPSPNKETQYIKDYVGRNLMSFGYTSLGGDRFDTYGSDDQRLKLVLVDESGAPVDPEMGSALQYYSVTAQSIEPNTEMNFIYSPDDEGNEEVSSQSIDTIQLTVKISEEGSAALEQSAAEEEELRASGALKELYEGTYVVGQDLEAGNYQFKELTDAFDVYLYQNEHDYNYDEKEWYFINGADDVAYLALRDGMYVRISDNPAKAIRSDFPAADASEMDLYEGVYKVGTDIVSGSYAVSPISSSCDTYIYQSEADYEVEKRDWDFLNGKDDIGYYQLQDGMVFEIKDGAAKATRNG